MKDRTFGKKAFSTKVTREYTKANTEPRATNDSNIITKKAA
ncbi:hypothetical protein [Eubacterium sp.]